MARTPLFSSYYGSVEEYLLEQTQNFDGPSLLREILPKRHYSAKSGSFEFLQWNSMDGSFGKRAARYVSGIQTGYSGILWKPVKGMSNITSVDFCDLIV